MTLWDILRPLILMACACAWVWCLVDALRNHRPWNWVLLVVLLPPVAIPAYLLNFKMFGGNDEGRVDGQVKLMRRLRELQAEVGVRDVPALRIEMAEILMRLERWQEAIDALRPALDSDPEDLRAQYAAGIAWQKLGRPLEAAMHLEYVVDQEPKHVRGEARLAYGNALKDLGEDARAFEQYEAAARDHSLPEAVVRHARILAERGKTDDARRVLTVMLSHVGDLDPETLRKSRKWIREAAEDRKRLGE